MFKWLPGRANMQAYSRAAEETSRLEQKIEKLEQTMLQLAKEKEKDKQSVVVEQLHIHHPVVENVTFRLDALDIEELSGSLNLGNNFDVKFDPKSLFQTSKAGTHKPDEESSGTKQDVKSQAKGTTSSEDEYGTPLRRTASGYTFRTSPPPTSKR